MIDALVDEGAGESRSAVIRQSVHHLADSVRRATVGRAIGADEGIDRDGVATFDNLAAVAKSVLAVRLGSLGVGGKRQM